MSVRIHSNPHPIPVFQGLSLPQWVHRHPGSSARHCGWLLEDDLGNGHPHHRHADSVLRERQSECSKKHATAAEQPSWEGSLSRICRFSATLTSVSSAAKVWAPYVFVTFQIRCHKYWPEDNKPMSVFSDILVSKVSEEVLPDWTVRTLKVEKVKIPTHVKKNKIMVPIIGVIRHPYQLPNYWPTMFFLSFFFNPALCIFFHHNMNKYSYNYVVLCSTATTSWFVTSTTHLGLNTASQNPAAPSSSL